MMTNRKGTFVYINGIYGNWVKSPGTVERTEMWNQKEIERMDLNNDRFD